MHVGTFEALYLTAELLAAEINKLEIGMNTNRTYSDAFEVGKDRLLKGRRRGGWVIAVSEELTRGTVHYLDED